jgi:hypothetical protein
MKLLVSFPLPAAAAHPLPAFLEAGSLLTMEAGFHKVYLLISFYESTDPVGGSRALHGGSGTVPFDTIDDT